MQITAQRLCNSAQDYKNEHKFSVFVSILGVFVGYHLRGYYNSILHSKWKAVHKDKKVVSGGFIFAPSRWLVGEGAKKIKNYRNPRHKTSIVLHYLLRRSPESIGDRSKNLDNWIHIQTDTFPALWGEEPLSQAAGPPWRERQSDKAIAAKTESQPVGQRQAQRDNDTSVIRGPATMKAGRWNSYGAVSEQPSVWINKPFPICTNTKEARIVV